MVVSKAAAACDRPNSSRIVARIGPIETMPGRRSIATSTMATTANQLPRARPVAGSGRRSTISDMMFLRG